MKKVLDSFFEHLCEETGYDYGFIVEKYIEAMDNGVSEVDFVDALLDSTIF